MRTTWSWCGKSALSAISTLLDNLLSLPNTGSHPQLFKSTLHDLKVMIMMMMMEWRSAIDIIRACTILVSWPTAFFTKASPHHCSPHSFIQPSITFKTNTHPQRTPICSTSLLWPRINPAGHPKWQMRCCHLCHRNETSRWDWCEQYTWALPHHMYKFFPLKTPPLTDVCYLKEKCRESAISSSCPSLCMPPPFTTSSHKKVESSLSPSCAPSSVAPKSVCPRACSCPLCHMHPSSLQLICSPSLHARWLRTSFSATALAHHKPLMTYVWSA